MTEVAIESCFSFLALHYFGLELNHEKKYSISQTIITLKTNFHCSKSNVSTKEKLKI